MFTLPALPYDYGALEPHIDEATMKFHHDKHFNVSFCRTVSGRARLGREQKSLM